MAINTSNISNWNSIEPNQLIRLTAQYCSLNEKLLFYGINHHWNSAIKHPLAWLTIIDNQWNCDNNVLTFSDNNISYLDNSLKYITIGYLQLFEFLPIANRIRLDNRYPIYSQLKYLLVLVIFTDSNSNNQLNNIEYELIGIELSNSLIRLELNYSKSNKYDTYYYKINSNNIESLSKLSKLKILSIRQYNIELEGLYYMNQLTELRNLILNNCIGYSNSMMNPVSSIYDHESDPETPLVFDNSMIPTLNRLLYLDLDSSLINYNSLIELIKNNSPCLSNLLVFKSGKYNDQFFDINQLIIISKLTNLIILDFNEMKKLNNTILTIIGKECKLLKQLNLNNCMITEPMLFIVEFTELSHLNLSGNNLSVIDLVLISISEKLLKLKILILGNNYNYFNSGLNSLSILVKKYQLKFIGISKQQYRVLRNNKVTLLLKSVNSIINTSSESAESISVNFDDWNSNYIKIPEINKLK